MTELTAQLLDVDLRDVPQDDPTTIPPDQGERAELARQAELGEGDLDYRLDTGSGLSPEHRIAARHAAVAAAILALKNRDRISYTQGPQRWDGIAHHRFARRGDFPRSADCSAFVTWCIYQGVRFYNLRDVVNGQDWQAGFTGTMLHHGAEVDGIRHPYLKGDAVLYGRPGTTGAHTTLYVGGGMVISHGSDPGPFLLQMDYRPDRLQVRRYI